MVTLYNDILHFQEKLAGLRKAYFFQDELFSYQWWLIVVMMLTCWVVWGILLDRKRFRNILLIGCLSMGFALVLDDIGLTMARWNYPYKIVYFTTRLSLVDMVILPVAFMLIYQYCRKWATYIIFSVLFALFAAFIAEPIFVKLNMYTIIDWHYMYSAPIYVAIGVVVKGIVDITEFLEKKAKKKH